MKGDDQLENGNKHCLTVLVSTEKYHQAFTPSRYHKMTMTLEWGL